MNAIGLGFVLTYCVLSAAQEVYVGALVQAMSPSFLLVSTFGLTAAFFNLLPRGPAGGLGPRVRRSWRDVAAVNVTTFGAWVGFFHALRYVEPAIVSVLTTAVGPVLTLVLGRRLRPGARASGLEWLSALGILASLLALLQVALSGKSAVGAAGPGRAWAGVAFALTSGIAVAANRIYSKRLSEAGWSAHHVMAVRFHLLLAAALVLWVWEHEPVVASLPLLIAVLLITALGNVLPLYCLQRGLQLVEPVSIAFIVSALPVFTLGLQMLDQRLAWSAYSAGGIGGSVGFLALGVWARARESA